MSCSFGYGQFFFHRALASLPYPRCSLATLQRRPRSRTLAMLSAQSRKAHRRDPCGLGALCFTPNGLLLFCLGMTYATCSSVKLSEQSEHDGLTSSPYLPDSTFDMMDPTDPSPSGLISKRVYSSSQLESSSYSYQASSLRLVLSSYLFTSLFSCAIALPPSSPVLGLLCR
jgi:hypothetical protein